MQMPKAGLLLNIIGMMFARVSIIIFSKAILVLAVIYGRKEMRIIIPPPIPPHGGYSLIETKILAAVVLMPEKNILTIMAYFKRVVL
ncbi:hypothetical protein N5853_06060 [Bartonella sp. HY329]|uniref:hypothetical protein n=1 Tax=unclassified Bartonella TaxID=2645622 RepID=UPI0021C778F6|nr:MULTISPECIES: hypothetical protein [unclassified Bartonella]UXM96172.1 hypothetical protein N5853_06060 [Bartonella sp. HY329]UXN10496.1 hypothetical protein N5852_06065 [Bartonella sp. HY328]